VLRPAFYERSAQPLERMARARRPLEQGLVDDGRRQLQIACDRARVEETECRLQLTFDDGGAVLRRPNAVIDL
jgi:hypothetical protein